MIPLQEPRKIHPFSLFNLAFRPFFLFGALAAITLVSYWLMQYRASWDLNYYMTGIFWHSHEMLFGFSIAIISGFLLTAVRNWTNHPTPSGWPLALMALLWLIARILPFFAIPQIVIAAVDLAFIPTVAIGVAIPIIRSGNHRNLVFIAILSIFFIANLLTHLQLLGVTENSFKLGIDLALYLTLVVITIIGGRVIPFFTERAIGNIKTKKVDLIEKSIIPLSFIWLGCITLLPGSIAAIASLLMAGIHSYRLVGWWNKALLSHPLLWILHIGYGFLALGCALLALSSFNLLNPSSAVHALTVGSIGCLTLGMMARVSLGHTGHNLHASKGIIIAFVLMIATTLFRISIDFTPLSYQQHIFISGVLWGIAWGLFIIRYTMILIRPRADGLWG